MKKRVCLVFLLMIIFFNGAFTQSKRANNWVTGYSGNEIHFKVNGIATSIGQCPLKYFTAGNSCISDTDGNLILLSNGFHILSNTGNFIEFGDTLVPHYYYNVQSWSSFLSQTSIFLPMDSNKYYFVTPTFSDTRYDDCHNSNGNCYFDLLLYNVIDMNANGGLGKVTKRMQPLLQNANLRKTQMMACKHGNGKDWWLLKNEGDNADVHTFLFTQDSVFDKGVQTFNTPNWGPWDIRGQSTFNADGSKFATATHCSSCGVIFIADFDRCHGLLSNPRIIERPWGTMYDPVDTAKKEHLVSGLSFSPNGRFLYVSGRRNIYQYDLQDSTWYHVVGLDTSYAEFQDYETLYNAPDDKIYAGNWGGLSKQMSRIDNPDVKGAACNFCPRCLRLDSLGANGYVGTPPCMPNYGLGAKTCWPLSNSEIGAVRSEMLAVYPNPASTSLTIELTTNKKGLVPLDMYNMVGELVLKTKIQSQTKIQINISSFPKGVYVIRCEGVSQKVVVE